MPFYVATQQHPCLDGTAGHRYEMLDAITAMMLERLPGEVTETVLGRGTVKKLFDDVQVPTLRRANTTSSQHYFVPTLLLANTVSLPSKDCRPLEDGKPCQRRRATVPPPSCTLGVGYRHVFVFHVDEASASNLMWPGGRRSRVRFSAESAGCWMRSQCGRDCTAIQGAPHGRPYHGSRQAMSGPRTAASPHTTDRTLGYS